MMPPKLPYALPLPALVPNYVRGINGAPHLNLFSDQFAPPLEYEVEEDGSQVAPPLVNHPYALYSAGVADLNLNTAATKEPVIHSRDRKKSFLMTDSGGFQAAKGTNNLKNVNWQNTAQANQIRERILRWIEQVADVSMNLDIPIWAVSKPTSGFFSKKDCLNTTVANWDYFVHHQKSRMKWINCLHGNDENEGIWWYDAVKGYPTAGWAFGSQLKLNLFYTLWMLLHIRDDSRLEGIEYLHFLGTLKAAAALFYTQLQRVVRTDYPNIRVTFDAANPFVNVGVWGRYIFDYQVNKRTTNGEFISYEIWKVGRKLKPQQYTTKMADNLARELISIKGANACVWIAQKNGMQNYPKLKQAADVLEQAWTSPNWQSVLLKNRTFLESYL
jgi:hypothetical protein